MTTPNLMKKQVIVFLVLAVCVLWASVPVSTAPEAFANVAPQIEIYKYVIDASNFPAEAISKRRFYIATPKTEVGEIEIIRVVIRKTSEIVGQAGNAYIAHTYELSDRNIWSFIGLAAIAPGHPAGASEMFSRGGFHFPQFVPGTNVVNKQISFAVSPWWAFGSTPISGFGVLEPLPTSGTYEITIVVSNKNGSTPAFTDYVY